ncbi:unnamed protein product [Kuraishia capsulata CBS 1993]|uniref:DUF1868 domain-containing protein n=1 Tax=Kuraishia capsulata CBS 1993 TaxID=1382522 RepID=W6MPG9_9ASCO|nr:uncharacterized protein KUCA_T00004514001 [Kuraishia capsulata CBS 1993]CDK28531.1 unnamed protein product [Kuraishia capsulata CBS 1993]
MGKKFNADGSVRPFAGNTIVCHLPQQGPQRAVFKDVLEFYKAFPGLPYKGKITMLPASTLHVTLFDVLHEFKRDSEYWPKELANDVSMDECNQWMVSKLKEKNIKVDLPIRLLVDSTYTEQTSHGGWDTWKLQLVPLDQDEEVKIRNVRQEIAGALGIPEPKNTVFHVTVAYINEDLTAEESALLKSYSDKFHHEGRKVLELGCPEVCSFPDMFYMERICFLGE